MYKTKLRSQSKNKNKNKRNQNKINMETVNSPAQKRLREVLQTSFLENTPKNIRITNTESPLRLVHMMDNRFEKLTDQLQSTIQNMFRECEDRFLAEMDKKLNIAKLDLDNIADRVMSLETVIHEIKNENSNKVIALSKETEILRREVDYLKNCVRKQENSIVACDLRINGIPEQDNEDLFDLYLKICQTINISPPNTKSIFRIKIKRNFGGRKETITDPPIIIKFKSPYDRNFVLKSITSWIKTNKDFLRLNLIGFDSTVPFFY